MSELAVSPVTANEAPPRAWCVFLHGILGSGANWRTFARQLVAARPAWGALLVDLRLHGDSQGFAPPHTIEAAAGDVVRALAGVSGPARAVLGHSFGGKVGIELARQLADGANGPLEHLFVVDSTPSARPDHRGSSGVRHIVDLLMELPDAFPDRASFTSWVEARGVSRPTAMWLAMNVRPAPNTTRFEFRIDVRAVRAMLEDYFARDAWATLERPPGAMRTHFIVGGDSDVVSPEDLDRARRCPRMTVDVIEGAGHWVHVDAPDAVSKLVLGGLAR